MSNAFSDLFASAKFFQADGQGVGTSRSVYQRSPLSRPLSRVETASGKSGLLDSQRHRHRWRIGR